MSALHGSFETKSRWQLAHWVAALGVFGLAACAVLPSGLLPFGLCLLLATLLAPDLLWKQARALGWVLGICVLLAISVIALWASSILVFDLSLHDLDNAVRFIVLPWAALWAFALRPSLRWLWVGALVGVFAACGIAIFESSEGVVRANGWNNAIVFADVVLLLCALIVLCRPVGRWCWWWVAAGMAAGSVTILLSGSRGAWLGMIPVLVTSALALPWGSVRQRLLVLAGACAVAVLVVAAVPALNTQVRIAEFNKDLDRMEVGDTDSSVGVRLERFELAIQAFARHPAFGVGLGSFDEKVMALQPICQRGWIARCHMGHAHNDLAQWAATMGVPGIVVLLAIYGIPLVLFIRLARRPPASSAGLRGAAWAGVVFVIAFVLCGMTQSMFAHQLTSGMYAATVGVLLGLAVRAQRDNPAIASASAR